MTEFPWELFALAAVLAVNRLVVPATYTRPGAFWAIQVVDALLAVGALVWGLPGLTGFPQVGWLVAGLLAFHVLQNLSLRSQALTRIRRDESERDRVRKLRALEGPPEPGAGRPPDDEPAA